MFKGVWGNRTDHANSYAREQRFKPYWDTLWVVMGADGEPDNSFDTGIIRVGRKYYFDAKSAMVFNPELGGPFNTLRDAIMAHTLTFGTRTKT